MSEDTTEGGASDVPSSREEHRRITVSEDDTNDQEGLKICVGLFFTLTYNFILFGCGLALPIAMVVMGSLHMKDCPAEDYIPIYLVVHGVFCVAAVACSVLKRICSGDEDEESKGIKAVQSLFVLFLLAWLIAGSVWVYSLKGKFTTQDYSSSDYCDSSLYWFAFGVVTAYWVLVPAIGLFICCLWCCAACVLGFCCDVNDNIKLNVRGTRIRVTW